MGKRVRGIEELTSKMRQLGVNVENELEKAIRKSNKQIVQAQAKMLCPVDSGELRNSISEETKKVNNKIVGRVYTNKEHAPYVEFGTGQRGEASPSPPKADIGLGYRQDWNGMEAQPFLYPALKDNEDIIIDFIKKELIKSIRRVCNNG